ncbi:MAG: hypothetical protein ACMZ64_07545 [Oleiphilus sp.]
MSFLYVLRHFILCLTIFAISVDLSASSFNSELGLESRFFIEDGRNDQERFQPSVRANLEYQYQQDANSFELELFGRADLEDAERSHADVREAYWTHVADNWEMKAGVSKVFWGVTESRHLVDVINQTDLVENPDAEDKLGQPMLKFSVERDWGLLDIFLLPYFRERTFPGASGRLNALPYHIDTNNAEYESSAEQWRSDFSFRYATWLDDLEIAISHFSGTSRQPLLRFNNNQANPAFIPVYKQIDQTGLELQYLYEAWFWKLEAISSSGENQRYTAAVFGFEYTQVGVFDTAADLGWLAEYLFDDRRNQSSFEKAAPHSFERDVFFGIRLALNDIDSTEVLTGVIYDPKTEEAFYSLEFSQRVANDVKLNLEIRAFQGAEGDASSPESQFKTYQLQDEDYLQLELVKFF